MLNVIYRILKLALLFITLVLVIYSCSNKPKIISEPVESSAQMATTSGIFSEGGGSISSGNQGSKSASTGPEGVHTVLVQEVLPTERYVYMRVTENNDEFWVATSKQDIEVGKTYFFKNGLLKTNFPSEEYDRIFEKLYLVSTLVSTDHSQQQTSLPSTVKVASKITIDGAPIQDVNVEGSVKIAELILNKERYAGQRIQISGTCVKINPNIMGRNWIHLKDGSLDEYDLVITSDILIPVGHLVTLNGLVTLNKDFGAGYKYDLIIEEGAIVQ